MLMAKTINITRKGTEIGEYKVGGSRAPQKQMQK
jgi:hypothetical protein